MIFAGERLGRNRYFSTYLLMYGKLCRCFGNLAMGGRLEQFLKMFVIPNYLEITLQAVSILRQTRIPLGTEHKIYPSEHSIRLKVQVIEAFRPTHQ